MNSADRTFYSYFRAKNLPSQKNIGHLPIANLTSIVTKSWTIFPANGIHQVSDLSIYIFSPENWKYLTTSEMEKHTLSSCTACYINHQSLQECFPGKPVFIPPSIISLPECECTIRSEKSMTRKVLGELNSLWEE